MNVGVGKATEVEAVTTRSDDAKVEAWRLSEFLRLGWEVADAEALASSGCDLSLARRLVEKLGVDLHLAYQILI